MHHPATKKFYCYTSGVSDFLVLGVFKQGKLTVAECAHY